MNLISELEKERRLSLWKKSVIQEVSNRGKSIETMQLCKSLPHRLVDIFIRYLDGGCISFNRVPTNIPIVYFKYVISIRKGVPVCEQRMVYAGKQLEENGTLESYSIPHQATIHLILRLAGC